jgi:hypothetical protein
LWWLHHSSNLAASTAEDDSLSQAVVVGIWSGWILVTAVCRRIEDTCVAGAWVVLVRPFAAVAAAAVTADDSLVEAVGLPITDCTGFVSSIEEDPTVFGGVSDG